MKKEFKRFMELRHLISCNPLDKKLLKEELAKNYFQERLTSLSSLKSFMSPEHEENFFGSSARRFFKTRKYKFSKREMTVTAYNYGSGELREAEYEIFMNASGTLELKHIS